MADMIGAGGMGLQQMIMMRRMHMGGGMHQMQHMQQQQQIAQLQDRKSVV